MPILSWLTRDDDIRAAGRVPYRLLEEAPTLSAGDAAAANILIQGDNLDALKALLPFYAGQVKCIFIDPPYNTRSAFEHYNDNLEHTQWLSLMWPRLEILWDLLSENGSIWVSIDDNEGHYLKVLMDEVFGRSRFEATIVWQSRYSRSSDASISQSHNFILVYSLNPDKWKAVRNKLSRNDKQSAQYKKTDDDSRGPWRAIPWDAPEVRENLQYAIVTPTGKIRYPPPGRHWSRTEAQWLELVDRGLAFFGKSGNGAPSFKLFLKDAPAIVPNTWWGHDEAGQTDEAKKEIVSLFGTDPFATPKPERLIRRVIEVATNPGDLVLDSFLGSGTTAAVAHKMGRRYIGIEMGEHAVTHCAPRLRKVIDGEQGGISESVGWKGGGGFRFYRLGPPVFDAEGHIRPDITFAVLAAHIWFGETAMPWTATRATPFLGINEGRAFALLYNGILGDRRPDGGNVLTRATLGLIRAAVARADPAFSGPVTVYGEQSRITAPTLDREAVTFKQTPYDVKARR